jgi:hypothetical protein
LSQSDFFWSIVIAIGLSVLVALVEIPSRAKTNLGSCFVAPTLTYVLVLCFGNVITTVLAALAVVKLPASLAPYYFLLAPFFGVFGFETVLKNTNITMFDKGVLTIQTWIEKALAAAAAAAIDKRDDAKEVAGSRLEETLMTLSELEINTRVLQKLGPDAVKKLEQSARESSADTKRYKVLQLVAALTRSEAAALMQSRRQ